MQRYVAKNVMNSLKENRYASAPRDFGRASCSGGRLACRGAVASCPAEKTCAEKPGSLRVRSENRGEDSSAPLSSRSLGEGGSGAPILSHGRKLSRTCRESVWKNCQPAY
jgi:hypothetical protein